MSRAPWMVVTAELDPAVRDDFDAWHAEVHLPRVLAIPGVEGGRRLRNPPAGPNYAMLYVFADMDSLRGALASTEAQEARSDWQRWSAHMRDLTVHFYAEMEPPLPLYRHN